MEAFSNLNESYTRSELIVLNNFKQYCANKNLEYRFDLYTNDFLIKFLRAKNYKMEESYQMFVNYLKFANEFNITHINEVKFPNIDKIKIFYPHGFHKTTKTGNPILLQNLGEIKIDDINKLLPGKLLNQYIIFLLERMRNTIFPKCSIASNKPIDRVFCIIDLLGLTTSLMTKKIYNFLNTQLSICQNYYPGILDGLYFVNSGFLFRALWSTCKYFYYEETRQKIKLLAFDYKSKLIEKVSPSNLPKFIGGECNCDPYGCIFSDAGPWNEDNEIKNDNYSSYKKKDNLSFMDMINKKETNEMYEQLTLKSKNKELKIIKKNQDVKDDELGGSEMNNNNIIVNEQINNMNEI